MKLAQRCAIFFLATAALPSAGSTLRAFIGIKAPPSFHPDDSAEGIATNYLNQIYDQLFWINYEGNLQPALALSATQIDPLTLRIRLRQGVQFHNGEEFDSTSVKYTFDEFTDPIHRPANRFYGSTIKSVSIVDKFTVDIKTSVPDGQLVYRLALIGSMLPPHHAKKVGEAYFAHHPVGTGPFRFLKEEGDTIVLLANDRYWGGRPKIDRLEIHSLPSAEIAMDKLSNHQIDFAAHLPGSLSRRFYEIPGLVLQKSLTRESILLLLNTKKQGLLQDKTFRHHLVHALNFEDVIKYIYLGNGRATHSITFPGELFHAEPTLPWVWSSDTAKAYIRKKGLSSQPFWLQVTKPYEKEGSMIARQMRALGLNIKETVGTDEDEARAVLEKNENGQIPDIDMLLSYCSHKYSNGSFPLTILFHSKANWSMTNDPTLDSFLEQGIGEFEPTKQREYFQSATRYISDNDLSVPGFQLQALYGMAKGIHYRSHVNGDIYFKDVSMDSQ